MMTYAKALEPQRKLSLIPDPDPNIRKVLVSALNPGDLVVLPADTIIDSRSGRWVAPTTGVLKVSFVNLGQTRKGYHVHLVDGDGKEAGWISRHYRAWVEVWVGDLEGDPGDIVEEPSEPTQLVSGQLNLGLEDGFDLDWKYDCDRWQYSLWHSDRKAGYFYEHSPGVWLCYCKGWRPVALPSAQECVAYLTHEFLTAEWKHQRLSSELLEAHLRSCPF